jgi:hypothetical protein
MDNSKFLPVTVKYSWLGSPTNITSIHGAYDCLVQSWKKQETTAYLNARNACLYAMLNRGSVETARNAFIDAVKEAEIFVPNAAGR